MFDAGSGGLPVVVDLTDVTFIDSIALGVLVAAQRRLQAGGSRRTLRGASSRVETVLQTTGLNRLFEVVEDESPTPVNEEELGSVGWARAGAGEA